MKSWIRNFRLQNFWHTYY